MSLFSDRLGQTRKQLGVKQQIIASELKITRPAYSAWENGRNEPSISMLSQLCRILNVSADYLLGLTDTVKHSRQSSLPRSTPADPFSDLTSEQRTVIETTLNAFRQQNAASKEEA